VVSIGERGRSSTVSAQVLAAAQLSAFLYVKQPASSPKPKPARKISGVKLDQSRFPSRPREAA